MVSDDRMRGNGYKLKHRQFHPSRKNFFIVGVTEHWHRLPREAFHAMKRKQTDRASLQGKRWQKTEVLCG